MSSIFYKVVIGFFLVSILTRSSAYAFQNIITLHHSSETATEITMVLDAQNMTKPLIGISTTLRIPNNLTYQSYDHGQFFEQGRTQVTYLIAPKKNDPHTLVIGIASLGKPISTANGTLVTFHFSKQNTSKSTTTFALENTIVSGIQNQKRIDYPDIIWAVDSSLAKTGSDIAFAGIVSLLLTSLLMWLKVRRKR